MLVSNITINSFMEGLKMNYKRLFAPSTAKKILLLVCLVFVFDVVLFYGPNFSIKLANDLKFRVEKIANATIYADVQFENRLPNNKDREYDVLYTSYHPMTAYNSEVAQCDASPCITANGFNVCKHGIEDTIAANFLRFGTRVRIPDLFGERVFVVRDRMNARYPNKIDIWMKEKTDALHFGVKVAKIEVVE